MNPTSTVKSFDISSLRKRFPDGSKSFESAKPFEHVVIDDFMFLEVAHKVVNEFDASISKANYYFHFNEKKRILSDVSKLGPTTQALFQDLQNPEFISFVERITGIDNLLWDPEPDSAGLHETRRDGYLNLHTDFLAHPKKRTWSRQINMFIYLNEGWQDSYGGHLQLWAPRSKEPRKMISPIFNRVLLFHTTKRSIHGHPEALRCPPKTARKSINLYYYRDERRRVSLASTSYRPTPSDPLLKSVGIRLENTLLSLFSLLKRYLNISDESTTKLLKLLFKR